MRDAHVPRERPERAATLPAASGSDVRAVARNARADANMAQSELPLQADYSHAPGVRCAAGS